MLRGKPEISYPTAWGYRVIGEEEADLRLAIHQALGEREYRVTLSNESSGGKYVSLKVELVVFNEEERVAIFLELKNHPDVRMVL